MVDTDKSVEGLDTAGAAKFISGKIKKKLSPKTMERWRIVGGGPVFVRLGGSRTMYLKSDLIAWLMSQRRTSTSDRGTAE